jgi:hypothetical protein
MITRSLFLAAATLALLVSLARAEDVYYVLTPDQLTVTQGKLPSAGDDVVGGDWRDMERRRMLAPYGALDQNGELFIQSTDEWRGAISKLAIHASGDKPVTGRIFVPKSDASGMEEIHFTIPAATAPQSTKNDFNLIKRDYYQRMVDAQYPGSAYFRHEARAAAIGAGKQPAADAGGFNRGMGIDDDDKTVSMASGTRAISESLQLDRLFPVNNGGEPTVDVDSIPGISITPMDWTKKIQGLNPALDPLAAQIPADQPAIFFPTFADLVALSDETDRTGTPLIAAVQSTGPMSLDDKLTRQRYEHQLGMSLSGLARLLGPKLIKSVAITASDPYLHAGTDVAVLFETNDAKVLSELLAAQLKLVAAPADEQAAADGFFAIAVSADRSVSCYMATLDSTVVVTNSRVQFQHLKDVQDNKAPAMAGAPEYVFFRDRYKLGQENESAFLILTDATIRRWCGPRWRIADSRRTRAAAAISELQAQYLADVVAGHGLGTPLQTDMVVPGMGNVLLTPTGVSSAGYGSLKFMTPIAELPITKVTQSEADMYKRWREGYERDWRWVFDPIAVRLSIQKDRLAADLSIMPLIEGSDYASTMELVGAAKIAPAAGDQHPDLAQLIVAIDKNSKSFGQVDFLGNMLQGVGVHPFSWFGQWVTIYADPDQFWKDMADAKDVNSFLNDNIDRMPVAVEINVSDSLRLTAFMVAVRAYIEQTMPKSVNWEALTYQNQAYVKISAATKVQNNAINNMAIYYATAGDCLVITPSLTVLQHALDRENARHGAPATQPAMATPSPWLGESFNARIDGSLLDLIRHGTHEESEAAAQVIAWRNLPILSVYHHLYPDQNPGTLHERLWSVRLADPADGQYVWNEKWQTMESTVYGSPAEPKEGPAGVYLPDSIQSGDFGLTFEDHGLRAVARFDRTAP